MVWDYHVVLIHSGGGGGEGGGDGGETTSPLVWDLDTTLPFPVPLERYAADALKVHLGLAPRYAGWGRRSLSRVSLGCYTCLCFSPPQFHNVDAACHMGLPPRQCMNTSLALLRPLTCTSSPPSPCPLIPPTWFDSLVVPSGSTKLYYIVLSNSSELPPYPRCPYPVTLAPLRLYRVVPGEVYLTHFASDRSHMRRSARDSDDSGGGGSGGGDDDGREWSAPPPPYPCIVAADGCTNNLYR